MKVSIWVLIYVFLCLVVLLCAYNLMEAQENCNRHWQKQLYLSGYNTKIPENFIEYYDTKVIFELPFLNIQIVKIYNERYIPKQVNCTGLNAGQYKLCQLSVQS